MFSIVKVGLVICLLIINSKTVTISAANNKDAIESSITTSTPSTSVPKENNKENLTKKLSDIIDKNDKIKNKEYKNDFISYVVSYEDKKKEYNDHINGGNEDKIKSKYDLYMESDTYIKSLNEKLEKPVYSHTKFSDWSMEEKKSILINENYLRRRLQSSGCILSSGFANNGSASTNNKTFVAYAQPIQDQRSCGSCWDFSSIAQYELNYYLKKGIKQKQSEQYVLDCVADTIGTCNGGRPGATNAWLGSSGSCPSTSYRTYDALDTVSCTTCLSNKTPAGKTYCINQYSTGYIGTSLNFWNIVANAAQYVGLSFGMAVSNNFYYIGSSNPVLPSCDSNNILGYHAMAIYGQSYGKMLYVRNSWGTRWGMNGYFWLNSTARTSCNFQSEVSYNSW